MKYWKKLLSLTLAMLALVSLFGCGGENDADEPDVNLADLRAALLKADTTLPEMISRSSGDPDARDSFTYLSDLDYGKVEEYFYVCADAGTAEEIAVIKLKNKSDAAALMDSLHKHLETRQGTFREYDPQQVPLVEDAVITREGRYVALFVSKKSSLLLTEFRKFFPAN